MSMSFNFMLFMMPTLICLFSVSLCSNGISDLTLYPNPLARLQCTICFSLSISELRNFQVLFSSIKINFKHLFIVSIAVNFVTNNVIHRCDQKVQQSKVDKCLTLTTKNQTVDRTKKTKWYLAKKETSLKKTKKKKRQ